MKLDSTKGVIDDHEDNFAIVFAAMGVSVAHYIHYTVDREIFTVKTFSPLSWSAKI